jgi:hypothetical protein
VREFVLGANPAIYMYLTGSAMADVLHEVGDEIQQHWASLIGEPVGDLPARPLDISRLIKTKLQDAVDMAVKRY